MGLALPRLNLRNRSVTRQTSALAAVDPRAIQRLADLLGQIERQGARLHEGAQLIFDVMMTKNPDLFTARALAREVLIEAAVTAPLANLAGLHLVTPPEPPKRRPVKSCPLNFTQLKESLHDNDPSCLAPLIPLNRIFGPRRICCRCGSSPRQGCIGGHSR